MSVGKLAQARPVRRDTSVPGESAPPLSGARIGGCLDEVARRDGGREALVVPYQHVRWTYRELKARSDDFAAGLLSLGLEPGDRVGIWAPNCAEWVVAQFATAKAGLILVNINPAYRTSELEHVLRAVECKALITAARFKSSDYLGMLNTLAPELAEGNDVLTSASLPALKWVITIGDEVHRGCTAFATVSAMADDDARRRLESAAAEID